MCPPVNPELGQRRFSAAATIDLRGANYGDWQLCLNEEEARGTAMETRWVGCGGRNGSNYADEQLPERSH